MSLVSERLRDVIDDQKLSLKEASIHTKIPYRSLQNYVSGKQLPGAEALIRLHDTFGVDLNWLLTGKSQRTMSQGSDLTTEEINPQLVSDITMQLKKSHKMYQQPIVKVAIDTFSKVYNHVCHISDSSERWTSIDKAIGLLKLTANNSMQENATGDLRESLERGKSKIIEQHGLQHENHEQSEQNSVNQNFNSSVGQVSGRDIINKK
ncbi:helix-turn-helix transcriptional regulator [Motilimonas sp. 1_MG-2023]|uniref:helix-turn-helix domain-containing protein n=1 Tax=Motilimonas sp. 1_MG-2023 TaxID=3062672 RepID=UPI0026E3970D|nr:helix-turn-helix transcriptional regulator [Motilimonas sp. 1_MG-2023]MDO6525788.1 helix-turn-helix transcriptional regulator [Motilimonas sp. 1_MG-2023]